MDPINLETTVSDQQELCVSCGFCCDKTLFDVAFISKGEKTFGAFAERETEIKGDRYFKLPCPYFDRKCTIYDKPKMSVCSSFECKLLRNMNKGRIGKNEAMTIIKETKEYESEILDDYKKNTGKTVAFRDLYHETLNNKEFENNPEKKKIKYKAQLLDIQLTKEFKSAQEFNQFYVMTDKDGEVY